MSFHYGRKKARELTFTMTAVVLEDGLLGSRMLISPGASPGMRGL